MEKIRANMTANAEQIAAKQAARAEAQAAKEAAARARAAEKAERLAREAAEKAVSLVKSGEADALMKGSLHTDELMAAVVRREGGLRTARRVSHCFVMDVPSYDSPLIVTEIGRAHV